MLEVDDAPQRADEMIAEAEDEVMQEEDTGMGAKGSLCDERSYGFSRLFNRYRRKRISND
jgi:hypothetical protein